MNEQDRKAFEAWFRPEDGEDFPNQLGISKDIWKAACDYKDKQYNPFGDSPDWVQEAMQRQARIFELEEQLAAKVELNADLLAALLAFRDGGPDGGQDFFLWHDSYKEAIDLARAAIAKATGG